MSSYFLESDMMVLIEVGFCQQSLQALKKISQEHPTACLRAGALMAVLSYLDFFSTGVQVTDGLTLQILDVIKDWTCLSSGFIYFTG